MVLRRVQELYARWNLELLLGWCFELCSGHLLVCGGFASAEILATLESKSANLETIQTLDYSTSSFGEAAFAVLYYSSRRSSRAKFAKASAPPRSSEESNPV